MNGWEEVIEYWQETFFVVPAYTLCVIIAAITGLIFHRKSKIGNLFLLYLSVDFTIVFLDDCLSLFLVWSKESKNIYRNITNVVICLVELNVYLYFFSEVIQSKKVKRSFAFLKAIFSTAMILFGINCFGALRFIPLRKFTQYIGAIEFLILLIPSFTFYSELFSNNSNEDILKRPSFWITTGIFLLSILSIPFYLIDYYLVINKFPYLNNFAALLFYTPLAFNYLLLSKAFLCKRVLTI